MTGIDYNNKLIGDLEKSVKKYKGYIKTTEIQIASLKKELEARPEVADLIGRCFISASHNQIYVILGPALDYRSKEVLPDRVNILSHSVERRDDELAVSKDQYNMDADQGVVLKDIEITKEQHDDIAAMWIKKNKKYAKELKALVSKHRAEMSDEAKTMLKGDK